MFSVAGCELPVGPTPPTSTTTPEPPRPEQTLDRVVTLAGQDIGQFWQRVWPQSGTALIRRVSAPVPSACGPFDPSGPGAYCGPDRTIFLSDPVLGQLMVQIGDFAVVTVMAHEWGHHIQAMRGYFGRGPTFELQADCFAGAYAVDAHARGLLDPGDAQEALRISWAAGGGDHGTPAQRVSAFQYGTNYGVNGCIASF
jgi:predicted metalloprotease